MKKLYLLFAFPFIISTCFSQQKQLNKYSKDFDHLYSLFLEKQEEPLTTANKELFKLGNTIWQRNYGEKEFYLTQAITSFEKYFKRIRSNGKNNSGFRLIKVELSEKSISLLKEINIIIPYYIKNNINVYLPISDINYLISNNIKIKYLESPNFNNNLNSKNNDSRSTIWYEDFEGTFPGSDYSVGDDDSGNGEDYWDDVNCRSFLGSWSIWCADIGDQPHCQNYDDYMESYVYKTTGIDVSFHYDLVYEAWLWYDTESCCDFLDKFYSSDGSTWYSSPSFRVIISL